MTVHEHTNATTTLPPADLERSRISWPHLVLFLLFLLFMAQALLSPV